MKLKLMSQPVKNSNTITQIAVNRGLKEEQIAKYTNLDDSVIFEPELLGEEALKKAATALTKVISQKEKAIVIVDSDCDGYTSAALLINYLHRLFPFWVENYLDWALQPSKGHGLSPHIDALLECNYSLVICPDSSSNDYLYHQQLKEDCTTVIVLDHHEADKVSEHAIVINNQLSDYPNKYLSGVGVTWQFCRYIDKLLNKNIADDFLDLVALGDCGDMMSLLSFETRYLISKGFRKEHISNPFIEYIVDKNSFPLSRTKYQTVHDDVACTSMGAAFFIVPFVNATTRTGTKEEKELIFKSMLEHCAFQKIPEVKRGKQTGKMEYLVLQAMRQITNIKNRQTREEEAGLAALEKKIADEGLLDSKILLFLLKSNEVRPEIRGLIANKCASKYQKPCCVLTERMGADGILRYEGSMRGYTKNGIDNFKEVLNKCRGVSYVQGHANAAGVGIVASEIENFKEDVNELLKEIRSDPVYYVDYLYNSLPEIDNQTIINIALMNDYWGQDFDRAMVGLKIRVTPDMIQLMKGNTLKIQLNKALSIIKFGATEGELEDFSVSGWREFQFVCSCQINKWGDRIYPQLDIEDYEIIGGCNYLF